MFAVVKIGGKQYKVLEGDIIFTEKINASEGDSVVFDEVLAISDDSGFKVGTPVITGATVSANVVRQGKSKKIYIIRYKPKKNYKRRMGHRQPYTKLQITTITA